MRGIVVASLLFACVAFGQTDRGAITGTISDPTGAILANAEVEARNAGTGQIYPTTSTATGNYTLAQLPAGAYELSITAPGFKRYNRPGLDLAPTQTLRIDVTMEVGASTESITVTSEATLLKTESGEVAQNVTVSQLNQLPILGV